MTPLDLIRAFETLADAEGGTDRLRELVLQLAVRGKLVAQDASDEPASVLLTRIAAEKARLVKEKKIRKAKPLPPIEADEVPFSVPEGWEWARVASLGDVIRGVTYKKEQAADSSAAERVKLLRAHNIQRSIDLHKLVYVPRELVKANKYLRQGDILFCIASGSVRLVGKSSRVATDMDATFGAFTAIVRPFERETSEYIKLFTHSPAGRALLIDEGQGIAIKNLKTTALAALPLPLPPLAEQHRIVAKVDALMGLLDRLEAAREARDGTRTSLRDSALSALADAEDAASVETAWTRMSAQMDELFTDPSDVAPLRQTIVDLASLGRLTPRGVDDRTAAEEISRIRERHRAAWIGRYGTRKTYVAPESIGEDEFPQLPASWRWERLGLLGVNLLNPVQTGPFGSKLKNHEFVDTGVPVIAVGNLTPHGFQVDNKYFVSPHKAEELSDYDVHYGDVLFARTGATLGKVCVAPDFVRDWRMSSHILRVRMNRDVLLPELVVLWLYGAAAVKGQIADRVRGMSRPGFNTTLLCEIAVPIPPLAEQHRIVAKVDALMALCDDLEARLTAAKTTRGAFAAAAVHHLDA